MHSISADIPLIKSAERFQLSPFNITVIILTQNRRGRKMLYAVPQYRAPLSFPLMGAGPDTGS